MAIAYVQKVTASGEGVNTQAATLTGVGAGNMLALLTGVHFPGAPINPTPSDDKTNTWSTTTAPSTPANNNAVGYLNYALNVAAGTTIVTVDYGTGFDINELLSEFSGIATSAALDVQTSNTSPDATTATPTSGTTGTTAQADELVLACMAIVSGADPVGIDQPSGFTNLHLVQDAINVIGHSSDYKIVSATGTQLADWGTVVMSGAAAWTGKIATFKAPAIVITPTIAWLTA